MVDWALLEPIKLIEPFILNDESNKVGVAF